MQRDLGALTAREHDVLVVGGGIVGSAVACDAAQRGLSVALVEANDFCSGASWNSLKTIHGGLRHLQRLDVPGLRESMRERRALLTIAPELVRPLDILVPAQGHGLRGIEALTAGARLADLLTPDRNRGVPAPNRIGASRRLDADQVVERIPGLARNGLTGGVIWTDAQLTSSERLVMGLLHAAARHGAALANYTEVTTLSRVADGIRGARVQDLETGDAFEIRARIVVNASGPGLEAALADAGLPPLRTPALQALNLLLAGKPPVTCAVGARAAGRFLFLAPWRDVTLVGTEYARVEAGDTASTFLQTARSAFPWADLDASRIRLVHRGVVPGRDPRALPSRHRLVDHAVRDGVEGLISLVTVKLTTARAVAEQAVDRLVARLGSAAAPCRTAVTPLPHAQAPGASLEERAAFAVREEMALHLDDLAARRLDVATAGPASAADTDSMLRALTAGRGLDPTAAWSERARLTARDDLTAFLPIE